MSGVDAVGRANDARGEAMVAGFILRPSFDRLVAAEAELGPLFALVERAAAGKLTLSETVALLWHVVHRDADDDAPPKRADFAEALTKAGLSVVAPALRTVLGQILKGR
jgi:hypothetical protein